VLEISNHIYHSKLDYRQEIGITVWVRSWSWRYLYRRMYIYNLLGLRKNNNFDLRLTFPVLMPQSKLYVCSYFIRSSIC